MYSILIKAYFTGFFAACIVGPVFTLILYRTIVYGLRAGVISAMGMAIADGTFFTLSVVSGIASDRYLLKYLHTFESFGGPLMIIFGLWTLLRKPSLVATEGLSSKKDSASFFYLLSAMLLTMANPLTLIFFGTIASQIIPELNLMAKSQALISGACLSLGSFSLLFCAILIVKFQSKFNLQGMITFLKTVSGFGLLFTGLFLCTQAFFYQPGQAANNALVVQAQKQK